MSCYLKHAYARMCFIIKIPLELESVGYSSIGTPMDWRQTEFERLSSNSTDRWENPTTSHIALIITSRKLSLSHTTMEPVACLSSNKYIWCRGQANRRWSRGVPAFISPSKDVARLLAFPPSAKWFNTHICSALLAGWCGTIRTSRSRTMASGRAGAGLISASRSDFTWAPPPVSSLCSRAAHNP